MFIVNSWKSLLITLSFLVFSVNSDVLSSYINDSQCELGYQAPLSLESCLVQSRELVHSIDSYRVVDVRRHPEQAIQFYGILNIPFLEFLHIPTFKGNNALLIDSGFNSELRKVWCEKLSEAGFTSAHILDGGALAYSHLINQKNIDRVLMSSIEARQFWTELKYSELKVIALDEVTKSKLRDFKIGISELITRNKLKRINQFVLSEKINLSSKVILVGIADKEAKTLVRKLNLPNLFYLSGGVGALDNYFRNHKKLIDQQNRTVNKAMICNV